MSKTRVFIYGSCVSRDTFEHLDPEQFELVEYVARQSVLSATTRPVESVAPPTLQSRFQQRMVTGDFQSSLRPLLAQHAADVDVLLIDLTDERLGVYLLPDGTVVTRSVELIESGAEESLPQGAHYVAFGTQQHYEYWSGAIRALGDSIRQTAPRAAVALLDIPWAEWSESGQQTPDSFGVGAAQANPVFRSYVEVAVQALGAHVIALEPSEVMSGPHHPWGDAPFHYAEGVYLEAVRRLTGAEGRVVWGPGAAAARPASTHEIASSGSISMVDGVHAAEALPQTLIDSGPNLFIAGTQKAGTAWLCQQLTKHPDVYIPEPLVLNHFNRAAAVASPEETAKYLGRFSDGRGTRWRGDGTAHYFWHTTDDPFSKKKFDAADAISETANPEAQVLLSLRDPVSRAVAAYWQHFAAARIDLPQSVFKVGTNHGVIDLGFYRRHHLHWSKMLGTGRISVLLYDDLVSSPQEYLQQALGALGLHGDQNYWQAVSYAPREDNLPSWVAPFRKRHPFDPQEIAALLALYMDDIRYVEELLERDLPEWRDLDLLIERNSKNRPAKK